MTTPIDDTLKQKTTQTPINFLSQLSYEQVNAVRYIDGSSIISAGAGSGKARVLTYKVAYLISKGVPQSNILALTFTNKAANEMKERIINLLFNQSLTELWMGTFHSIFLRILRENNDYLKSSYNLSKKFLIYDQKSKYIVLETIIEKYISEYKEAKRNNNLFLIQKILSGISDDISKIKNEGKSLEECLNDDNLIFNHSLKEQLKNIYKDYCQICLNSNAIDFDDILLFTYKMLSDNEEIANKYRKKFKYILVDEYQDTNAIQFNIIDLIYDKNNKICVVGDDAQCIYSFRGSKIENIQKFRKKYSPVEFKLTVNYRSTKTIVEAANKLIQNNEGQSYKILIANSEKNILKENKIKILSSEDNIKEARKVIEKIIDLRNKNEIENNWSSFAILYRVHKQAEPFETILKNSNIPYEIVGKINFLEKDIISLIISYLRIIINENDNISLQKIFNLSFTNINQKIKNIFDKADKNKKPYWFFINGIDSNKDSHFKIIDSFRKFIIFLKNKIDNEKPIFFIEQIVDFIKSNRYSISSSFEEEDEQLIIALKNMTEFLTQKYEKKYEININDLNQEKAINENRSIIIKYNLKEFLDDLILLNINEDLSENLSINSRNTNPQKEAIKLMTIHSSKGLEYNTVFIIGVEQGIYPIFHPKIRDKKKNEEEERRMFYVAITRAKQNCFISYAQNKVLPNGIIQKRKKSQFIDELENKCLDFSGDFINNDNKNESFINSSFFPNYGNNSNSFYHYKQKSKSNNINYKNKNKNYFKKSYSNSFINKKRYNNFGDINKNE